MLEVIGLAISAFLIGLFVGSKKFREFLGF